MQQRVGILVPFAGGILAMLTLACGDPDQGAPGGVDPARIASKCRQMEFDTSGASTVLDLMRDGTVRIRIVPARRSIHTKLKHLGSTKGRIIAIAVNTGRESYPSMAVAPNDTSCWHVWLDKDDVVRAQWVSIKGTEYQADLAFDIKFHPERHARDSSEWVQQTVSGSDARSVFHLAGMEPARLLFGDVGWTTCLINGCCRSRQ